MAPYDVRVIVVSPGLTESEIDKTMLNEAAREFWSKGKKAVGAIAAEDVAKTILFAYQMPAERDHARADDHTDKAGILIAGICSIRRDRIQAPACASDVPAGAAAATGLPG